MFSLCRSIASSLHQAAAASDSPSASASSTPGRPAASPKRAEGGMAPPQKRMETGESNGADIAALQMEKKPEKITPAAVAVTPAHVTEDSLLALSVRRRHLQQMFLGF